MSEDNDDLFLPKYMREKSTRKESDKKVKKLAKKMNGRPTINSGATLQQNDLTSADFDVEHKYTDKSQYTLKVAELEKMERRADVNKIPLFVIDMGGVEYAVLKLSDLIK